MDAPSHPVPVDPADVSCTAVSLDWAFEQSPDCVKLMAPNGDLLAMNVNGQRSMEIDDMDLLYGVRWDSLWPPATRPQVLAAIASGIIAQVLFAN